MPWRNTAAALDYLLADYLPTADDRLMGRIMAAYAESGAIDYEPMAGRAYALTAWADDLERRKQEQDGCQALTRKGTKCRSRTWPYCSAAHRPRTRIGVSRDGA